MPQYPLRNWHSGRASMVEQTLAMGLASNSRATHAAAASWGLVRRRKRLFVVRTLVSSAAMTTPSLRALSVPVPKTRRSSTARAWRKRLFVVRILVSIAGSMENIEFLSEKINVHR